MKKIEDLPISCKETLDLAKIIDQTAQIEDLIGVQGMEKELSQLASLPIVSSIPSFAERIDEFNHELVTVPPKMSQAKLRELYDENKFLRDEANKYIISALSRCIVLQSLE